MLDFNGSRKDVPVSMVTTKRTVKRYAAKELIGERDEFLKRLTSKGAIKEKETQMGDDLKK